MVVYLVQNKEDLDQKLTEAGDKLVVIDFYASWCGPCKIIAPKLEELAQQYADRAVVLKVNVDDNEEVTAEYSITSMPTFVFIKNGEMLDLFVGGNSEKLVKSMEKFVGGADVPQKQTPQEDAVNPEEGSPEQETEPNVQMDTEAVLEN